MSYCDQWSDNRKEETGLENSLFDDATFFFGIFVLRRGIP